MKKCLCCGHSAEDDAPTCSACGEASWSQEMKAVAPAEAEEADAAPAKAKKARR